MAPPVKIDDVSVRVMCCFLLILVERCIFIQLHSAIRASEGAVVDTAAAAASQLFCSVHKHVSSRFGIPVIASRLVRTALWWMTARQVAGQSRARSDFFVRPTGCVCVYIIFIYLFPGFFCYYAKSTMKSTHVCSFWIALVFLYCCLQFSHYYRPAEPQSQSSGSRV